MRIDMTRGLVIPALCFSALCGAALISTMAAPCEAAQQPAAQAEIEATVRQFWSALGDLDASRIKQTLDWPSVVIETSSTGATPANVVHNEAELDAEIRRANPNPDGAKRKGDFYDLE